MDYKHRVVPFYMAYPTPYFVKEEDHVAKDLEYLQQMYPSQVRQYQQRIAEIVDKLDYEGSMIYDEYPDRWQIYALAQSIVAVLKQEEETAGTAAASGWEDWLSDMVQILLCHEIYKRRHCGKRGFLKF